MISSARQLSGSDQSLRQPRPSGEGLESQCLFLRGFKISLSEHAWNELCDGTDIDITNNDSRSPEERHNFSHDRNLKGKGEDRSGSHSSSRGNLGNSVSLSSFPSRSISFHPSDKINDLLLSLVPDAQIAITHDSVWMDIAKSKDYEKEKKLAAIFASRYMASYCDDTRMCTFEPDLTFTLDQVESSNESNIKLSEMLTSMWYSIHLYNEQGKWEETKEIQIEILNVQTRTLGKEHPDTLATMRKLALTYYKQDKWTDAENLQSQALDMRTRILGKEHPDTLDNMHESAVTYYKQDRWADSENLQSQVLEMRARIFGDEHPDTLASMYNLAIIYYKQDRWTEAENIQSQVLELQTRILGKEHPETLASMHNLAMIYYKQDRCIEAENLQSQVLRMSTQILGNEHLDILASMSNLAITYYKQDKLTEAENLQSQTLEIHIRILGLEHPDTLASMHNLAMIYYKQDRRTEAEDLLSQILEIQSIILGKEHPNTLASERCLIFLRNDSIKSREAGSAKRVPEMTRKNKMSIYQSIFGGKKVPNTYVSRDTFQEKTPGALQNEINTMLDADLDRRREFS